MAGEDGGEDSQSGTNRIRPGRYQTSNSQSQGLYQNKKTNDQDEFL